MEQDVFISKMYSIMITILLLAVYYMCQRHYIYEHVQSNNGRIKVKNKLHNNTFNIVPLCVYKFKADYLHDSRQSGPQFKTLIN